MNITKNIVKALPFFIMAIVVYAWIIPLALTQYDGLIKTTGTIVGFDRQKVSYKIGLVSGSHQPKKETIVVRYTVDGKEYGTAEATNGLEVVSTDGLQKAGDNIDIYYDKKFPEYYLPLNDYDPNNTKFAYVFCGLLVLVGISKLFSK